MSENQKPISVVLLESIDASLKELLGIVRPLVPKGIADDRDLDGKYGDPEVRFDPKDWTGQSYKGVPMSQCPPAFLDMVAETLDYFAERDEAANTHYNGKPTAPYKRKDAMRARGWAKRMREGKIPTPVATGTHDEDAPGGAW
jgi:hypothetical protein